MLIHCVFNVKNKVEYRQKTHPFPSPPCFLLILMSIREADKKTDRNFFLTNKLDLQRSRNA